MLGRLQSAPKGDTFLAAGEDFAKTYMVKSARRGVGENAAGVDCRERLQNESRFLEFLAARDFECPRLVASDEGAMVVEDIDGIPLHELPRAKSAAPSRVSPLPSLNCTGWASFTAI